MTHDYPAPAYFPHAQAHIAAWIERLQDALDGRLAKTEAAEVQAHVSECAHCWRQYSALQRLDKRLKLQFGMRAWTRKSARQFDQTVYAKIRGDDQYGRRLAQRREQMDYKARLESWRSARRGMLRFQFGNIVGVMSLVATVWYFGGVTFGDLSGYVANLSHGTLTSAMDAISPMFLILTASIVAAGAVWLLKREER